MKNLLIITCILFMFSACQKSPQVDWERDGVSLTCPEGWEITLEENLQDIGYVLSIEKTGMNSSGTISISWVNAEIDMDEWIEKMKLEFENNIIYKNSNLHFYPQTEDSYSEINTISSSYTCKLFGLEYEGIMHTFHEKGKTFWVLIQEAVEDKNTNRNGFKTIEKSFRVK